MANTELRRRLGELAQQFVEGVVQAIQAAPIAEVASAAVNGADVARTVGRAAPAGRRGAAAGRGGAKRGAAAAGRAAAAKSGAAAGGARGGRGGRPRKLVRRASNEIQQLRDSILKYLRGTTRPVGASEIGGQLGVKTADLAFPMNQLRKQGLVLKQGERTQAVYSLSARGSKKGKKK